MSRTVTYRRTRALVLAAALSLGSVTGAEGQSLFAQRGLGLVIEPVDARGAALGGVALGLPRGEITWANPAELAGLPAAGLQAVYRYDSFRADFGGRSADGSTARFPLILGAFPIGQRWVFSAGYGGFLDQNWAVEQQEILTFGEDSVAVTDRFVSEGGVARLRLGAAYRINAPLSVGAGLDLYTGLNRREYARRFPTDVQTACCIVEWRYSGVGGTAGAAWSPSEALDLSLAASFGGTLEAKSDTAGAVNPSFSIPLILRGGGSAQVAGNTLLAASAEWGGWSALDGQLATVGGARDSWSLSAGVEWEGVTVRDRPVPLRLGGRHAALPFSWAAAGTADRWATERALTAGLGIVLGGGAASTDLSFEVGRRGGGGGLEESFSRFVLSVTALGR